MEQGAAEAVKHDAEPAVAPKDEEPAAQERPPAEAAPAGAPAAPLPSEQAPPSQPGEPPRKKHHLLRHELTKEAQEAAVAHFNAGTALEAAHVVWTLKQRDLQDAFARVYGTPTNSCNNDWMRGKLLQALGMDSRWKPESMQVEREPSPKQAAPRDSPEAAPGDVSRYGRRRRTAALAALAESSGDEEEQPLQPAARRGGPRGAPGRGAGRGSDAGQAGSSKRVRSEGSGELPQPMQDAHAQLAGALSAALAQGGAPGAGGLSAALLGGLGGGGGAANGHGHHAALGPAAAPLLDAHWYARQLLLQQQPAAAQHPAALAQLDERRVPLTATAPRLGDGASLATVATALTQGGQRLPWALQQLQQQHDALLAEEAQQRQLLLAAQAQEQQRRQHELLAQLQQAQQLAQQDGRQPRGDGQAGLPPEEQPSWAALPPLSLSLSLGSLGLLPLAGAPHQLPPASLPAAAAGLGAGQTASGGAALQQQLDGLARHLQQQAGAGQAAGEGVSRLLEAQQALAEWRRAEAVQAAAQAAAASQAGGGQGAAPPSLWNLARPPQQGVEAGRRGGGPAPFNPFAAMSAALAAGAQPERGGAAVLPGALSTELGTLSTELHSLYNAWQDGKVSFLDA